MSGDPLPAIEWEQCVFPRQMIVGTVMREASAGSTAAAEAGPEACELGKRARDPGSSAGWTGGPWSYSMDP